MNTFRSVFFMLLAIYPLAFIDHGTAKSIDQGTRKHLRYSGDIEKESIPYDEGHRALKCYPTGTLCVPSENPQRWQQKCSYCCEKATKWPTLGGVWACGTCLSSGTHCDLVTPCTQACCSAHGHFVSYFLLIGEWFCD